MVAVVRIHAPGAANIRSNPPMSSAIADAANPRAIHDGTKASTLGLEPLRIQRLDHRRDLACDGP